MQSEYIGDEETTMVMEIAEFLSKIDKVGQKFPQHFKQNPMMAKIFSQIDSKTKDPDEIDALAVKYLIDFFCHQLKYFTKDATMEESQKVQLSNMDLFDKIH